MSMTFLFPSSCLPEVPCISNPLTLFPSYKVHFSSCILPSCQYLLNCCLSLTDHFKDLKRSSRRNKFQLDCCIFFKQALLSKSLSLKIASLLSHQPCMLILTLEQSLEAKRVLRLKSPLLQYTMQLEKGNIFSLVTIFMLKYFKLNSIHDITLKILQSSTLTCKMKC